MEHKKVNWGFLAFLALEVILMIYLLFWGSDIDLDNVLLSTVLAESTIFIPPVFILALSSYDEGIWARVGFKTFRPLTLLAVILYGVLIMPLGTLANAVSMLWVDNEVLASSEAMLNAPWYITLISSAVIAPFVEEFTFRGFMYLGYRRDGARISAVIMSALAFAFMHLNFNQAAYAFIIGVAFALIVEATGSIWASIICHFIFNFDSLAYMLLTNYLTPGAYEDVSVDRAEILESIPTYIIIAAVATILAICVLAWAAKLQGRMSNLRQLFEGKTEGEDRVKIITAPIVIAFILCLTYMILSII